MSLFLSIFLLVYSGIHLYFFLKLKAAFPLGIFLSTGLTIFLLLMVFAPILIRILENKEMESLARFTAYAGYLWMGFIFLFFSASLFVDMYQGGLHIVALGFRRSFSSFFPGSRSTFILPLIWALAAGCYGYFEALDIRVERVVIPTSKLPGTIKKLTIVQISDVHLGLIVRQERLKRIIADINTAAPDILVSTGDLVDGQINRMTGMAELLQAVRPTWGKFAVIGNHEVYAGLDQAIAFTERAGFRILRNEGLTVGNGIAIAGVNDPSVQKASHSDPSTEKAILSHLDPNEFRILLKHRPSLNPESTGLFDLQLSGHVHKGQIFPFNLITRLFFPVKTGFSKLPGNAALYVSRGSGTWGPPIRLLAPPEVTVFELTRQPWKT